MERDTLESRRRLYLLSRVVVARHYRQRLTLAHVAGAVASSPRQVQRAYAQFSELSFHEDLHARRMSAAAQLLIEQPAIPVRDVARLVGYRQAPYFARVFRERYGLPPARFREQARAHRAHELRMRRGQAQARERSAAASSVEGSAAEPAAAGGAEGEPGGARPVGRDSAASSSMLSARAKHSRISVPPPGARSA
jgi:AraC-like DNA-binding protein